ncbi:hypothetical protein Plhal703r1_c02g0011681 [Plasmopara halstedii]
MESDDSDEELGMRGLEDDVAPRVQKRKRRTKEDTLRFTEAAIQVAQSLVSGQTPKVVTAMARTLSSLAENTAIAPLLLQRGGKKKTEIEKCEAAGANHTLLKKLHSDKSNNI